MAKIHLLYLFSMLLLLQGCGTTNWQVRAKQIHRDAPAIWPCTLKVNQLMLEMIEQGIYFDYIHGYYKEDRHVWLEQKHRILDPSVNEKNKYHIEIARTPFHGDVEQFYQQRAIDRLRFINEN